MTLRRILLTTIITLLPILATNAEEKGDSVFESLYNQFFNLYSDKDKEKEFYEVSNKFQEYLLSQGKTFAYYKIRFNEVLYATEHNQTYQAIKKANLMMDDMKNDGIKKYDLVYSALGNIFESRGNVRMARHYYMEALNYAQKEDTAEVSGIYPRMASLLMLIEPDEAMKWNEKFKASTDGYPPYHKVYLTIRGIIHFTKNEKQAFLNDYKEFEDFCTKHPDLDDYGKYPMEVIKLAYEGKSQEALDKLKMTTTDLTEIDRYNMAIIIYQLIGEKGEAIKVANQRAYVRDSLNSDMLFDNLNEINVEMNVAKMKQEAAETHIRYFTILSGLLLLVILILIFWIIARRKARKQLIKKNEQLKEALSMAEEANKMKASFIRNITHEIRTPLNAINGFTQLLNNPNFELNEEDKNTMTSTIKKNVDNITQIVDEILQVADKESKSVYAKNDTINCCQFLHEMIEKYQSEVSFGVTMNCSSNIGKNFTIKTNETALRRIVCHLLDNAVKFTEKGSIHVNCELEAEQNAIRISVTDTGIGIPEDKQEQIFERFYKVDSFSHGIGLGLSVSRMIAQKLGGNLVLDSTYKEGSRFIVTIPVD
jgi:signal transduction histidine kinase